ncbi:MAG: tetratricopeptide repeat protein [Pseudomonadota bacterium]
MKARWTSRIGAGFALLAATMLPAAAQEGLAGSYLAASQADLRNDFAAASRYYDDAIQVRPDNPGLLNNGLVTGIITGRMTRALALAGRLQQIDPNNQIVALARLAEAFRAEDYDLALRLIQNDSYQLNPLFTELIEGWAIVGQGDFGAAVDIFQGMDGNSALVAYGALHHALAVAFAGDFASAAAILDGDGDGPLHLNRIALLTHIVALAQAERTDEALARIEDALEGGFDDPDLLAMQARLEAGEDLSFDQIRNAADGAASVFALMASALTREDAERLGLIYGRLATHIRPAYDEMTTLIGDTFARQGQFDLAAMAYEEVAPSSAWYVSAEIGRADALRDADRVDEAVEVLSSLSRERPGTQSVYVALGDTLRGSEDFERAAEAYTRAIDLIVTEAQPQWRLYYVRGITYERTGRWPEAEADFRKALELNPDQPNVLNYLGYSLVEMRQNLEEAQSMIERAVAQRPQDGFITDSLAWVLYRLGKYEEAVVPMERAVELEPLDPIINDHLGDVLWKVGRKTEAVFQWRRALSFEPTETDAARIRRKLEVGLDVVLEEEEAEAAGADAETALGD